MLFDTEYCDYVKFIKEKEQESERDRDRNYLIRHFITKLRKKKKSEGGRGRGKEKKMIGFVVNEYEYKIQNEL